MAEKSSLRIALEEIQKEKKEKLIPENIKEDVQVFDIVGTLKPTKVDISTTDVISSEILKNQIAYNTNGKVIGTMLNNGELTIIPSEELQMIPKGYTPGGVIQATDITISNDYQRCLALTNIILSKTTPYIPMEYIENISSNQYIILDDILIDEFYYLDFEFTPINHSINWQYYLGNGTLDDFGIMCGSSIDKLIVRIRDSEVVNISGISITDKNVFKITSEGFEINSTFKSYTVSNFLAKNVSPLYLFKRPGGTSSEARFYRLKLYNQQQELIHDIIPIKDMIKSVYAVQDKISNKVYYGATSDEFIGGEIIADE